MEMLFAWLLAMMTGFMGFDHMEAQQQDRHPVSYTGSASQQQSQQQGPTTGPSLTPPTDHNTDIYNGF